MSKSFQAQKTDGSPIGIHRPTFQKALEDAEASHRATGKHAVVVAVEVVWTTQGLDDAMREGGIEP